MKPQRRRGLQYTLVAQHSTASGALGLILCALELSLFLLLPALLAILLDGAHTRLPCTRVFRSATAGDLCEGVEAIANHTYCDDCLGGW